MINEYIKKIIFILLVSILLYLLILVFPKICNIGLSILSIFLPVIIAFGIAFILEPFVLKVDMKIKNRKISVLLVLLLILSILVLLLVYIIPKIKYQFIEFKNILPELIEDIKAFINKTINNINNLLGSTNQITFTKIEERLNSFLYSFLNVGKNIAKDIIHIFSIIFVVPIISVYISFDYQSITSKIKIFLRERKKERILNYLEDLSFTMRLYLKSVIIVMIILFILFTIAFTFLKLPYALVFALIISVTNVIPYIGSYLGGILPVLFALGDSLTKAIITIVICVIIQSVEANIITPMIQKKYTEIKPLYTIISLIVFGKIFGFIGMILAIPLANFIRITLKHYPIKFLNSNNQ